MSVIRMKFKKIFTTEIAALPAESEILKNKVEDLRRSNLAVGIPPSIYKQIKNYGFDYIPHSALLKVDEYSTL